MPQVSPLRRTALNSVHRSLCAKMVDFGGWDMPVQYSGILAEHMAVRKSVGVFDVSHMGEIEIRGPQAAQLTDFVTTNAVHKLQTGQAHYTGLLYEHGGFVDDILVHKVAGDHFFLCVNASNQEKDFEHIRTHNRFDATVELTSDRYSQIAIQGPQARATLEKLTPVDLTAIKYYWFTDGEVAGVPARIAHTGYTGEDGFEIYIPPAESERIWARVLEAGAEFGIKPCGLGARDTLRTEACYPLYGHELDEQTTPIEAGLGFFMALDKGEFNGRAVLAAQNAAGVKKKLVAFKMTDKSAPPRPHYPIWADGKSVGEVTSGTQSPSLNLGIGMGYVPPEMAKPDTRIEIEIRGKRCAAVVVPKPIYRKS
jgi:aminomethyltransferase